MERLTVLHFVVVQAMFKNLSNIQNAGSSFVSLTVSCLQRALFFSLSTFFFKWHSDRMFQLTSFIYLFFKNIFPS